MKLFKATDLPEPVAPAISKCGILLKSIKIGLPRGSTPKIKVSSFEFFKNDGEFNRSNKETNSRLRFGI